MLKVEANSMDGTSLTLDQTKPMMVSIPASTTGAGMQLFLTLQERTGARQVKQPRSVLGMFGMRCLPILPTTAPDSRRLATSPPRSSTLPRTPCLPLGTRPAWAWTM